MTDARPRPPLGQDRRPLALPRRPTLGATLAAMILGPIFTPYRQR
jgi:hypothetical protein